MLNDASRHVNWEKAYIEMSTYFRMRSNLRKPPGFLRNGNDVEVD